MDDARASAEIAVATEPVAERARAFAPVVWLVGKVQSGKSSIVRTLTSSAEAEIGQGFAACTRASRVFDFPGAAPIIRFLDTRGVGEAGYTPDEDIAFCEQQAHLIIAVVKAADMDQGTVVDVLKQVRKRHPEWPIVVAQTTLHELYPAGMQHPTAYPFAAPPSGWKGVPDALSRALTFQRSLFDPIGKSQSLQFVPIDFTLPGDGMAPEDFGRGALIDALVAAAPAAVSAVLSALPGPADATEPVPNSYVLGFALAAGASDAVPLAGLAAVPVIQAAMLRQIAQRFGQNWDRQAMAEFAGALGAGTLLRVASGFGVRQLVKLIPVYGQTVGAAAAAASSFATTFAMGKAAAYYLSRRHLAVKSGEIARVYREALAQAFAFSKQHPIEPAGKTG